MTDLPPPKRRSRSDARGPAGLGCDGRDGRRMTTCKPWRWPHILWGGRAIMTFPDVTRDITHYGFVWGPWFLGICVADKAQSRGNDPRGQA